MIATRYRSALLTLFSSTLLLSATLGQTPLECPDEGETEIAPPGRASEYAPCAVTTIQFHWAASADGQIKVVGAGVEGAIEFSQSTPAKCKDTVSSFSDTLAKCQGLSVDGQFCQSDAYEVVERMWESEDLDPCPSQNLLDWVVQFIASGGSDWPGCSSLTELQPVKHRSAQQYNCTGQTTGTASGSFIVVAGDPTSFVSPPLGNHDSDLHGLFSNFKGDSENGLPASVAAFELAPIEALAEFALESRTTWFDLSGAVSGNRRRSLFGSIDYTGRFRFESPQLARDAESGESVPFVETWVRDDRALYQWIPGQQRGMINPIQDGLAKSYERLVYPELEELGAWLTDPFRLLRGSMVSYSTSDLPDGGALVEQRLAATFPFQRATRTFMVPSGNGMPTEMTLADFEGHTLRRWRFLEYREVSPDVVRPMRVELESYDRHSGTLRMHQILQFRSATPGAPASLDLTPPSPSSGEWNLELPS